ncbi:MAG TPA: hypothetical protein VI729_11485 [Anaerolineales bacterium]|nr:hypothetical protein [Anaerolineales bacterium]
MSARGIPIVKLSILIAALTLASCTLPASPVPCMFTANDSLTAYRLPDITSDVFGTMPAGDTHEALVQTADGWVGFDPGVAQAANVGLARHRWILLNATVAPSCLSGVDVVTLADVEADVAASG